MTATSVIQVFQISMYVFELYQGYRCAAFMTVSCRSVISSTFFSRDAKACMSSLRSDMAADKVSYMSAATALRSKHRDLAAGVGGSAGCVLECLVGLQLTSQMASEACEEEAPEKNIKNLQNVTAELRASIPR